MTEEKAKEKQQEGKVLVHLLVITLGVTSWSIMNGLWVELPILVNNLPEGWTLPSLLTLTSQFGNFGPLGFAFLSWLFPKTKLETPVSFAMVFLLTATAILYAFLWKETALFGDNEYSVALLALTLCQSIFAATTSMSYLAFMSHLKARYISSIFIGMGLSGLLPALFAIGQGVGGIECVNSTSSIYTDSVVNNTSAIYMENGVNSTSFIDTDNSSIQIPHHGFQNVSMVVKVTDPRFSVTVMFMILAAIGVMSFGALWLLVYHPYCKTEHVDVDAEEKYQLTLSKNSPNQNSEREEEVEFLGNDVNIKVEDERSRLYKRWELWFLLGLQVWINMFQTGFLLAIQVYSSSPYGLHIYHGVTNAENIVDPLASTLTMFVLTQRTKNISGLALLGTLFTAYIITVAAMSPNPFLVHQTAGGVLVIIAWVMCTAFNVYSKVAIASVMRSQGRKSLIWTAGSSQTGVFIGAILAYVMINHLNLFQNGSWC